MQMPVQVWMAVNSLEAAMFGDCIYKKNTRALQVAPEMLSIPEHHDRVAEVVFLDPTKEVYSIVGEVKGDPHKPAEEKNTEQIIGLWKPHRKAMLFFIMKPDAVSLQILHRN